MVPPGFHLSHQVHNPAWAPADKMLAKSELTEVEALLLTSMAWAGRATKEPRRDIAFTQFAIAMESLMVPKGRQELTERLATRVTRLLESKLKDRAGTDLYRR